MLEWEGFRIIQNKIQRKTKKMEIKGQTAYLLVLMHIIQGKTKGFDKIINMTEKNNTKII